MEDRNKPKEILLHINPLGDRVNWLRSFDGCEQLTNEEATSICDTLDKLATILLENAAQKLHITKNKHNINFKKLPKLERKAA